MHRFLASSLLLLLAPAAARADLPAVQDFEHTLSLATASKKVTVVHFWAPWCPNCAHELAGGGWSGFIAENPDVNFVFVTVWNDTDGRAVLARNGVGAEPNFQLLLHPNGSRKRSEAVHLVLGMPLYWIPSTWVFQGGRLTYAMNYGELRFPALSQMIKDSRSNWD